MNTVCRGGRCYIRSPTRTCWDLSIVQPMRIHSTQLSAPTGDHWSSENSLLRSTNPYGSRLLVEEP